MRLAVGVTQTIASRLVRLGRSVGGMSWATRREFFVVAALTVGAEVGVRIISLDRLARLYGVRYSLDDADTLPAPIDVLPPWAWQRLRVVGRVMRRWPVDGVCLRQSLVAGQRVRALAPELKLGVSRTAGRVEAHAWLEISGKSLDETSVLYAELPVPQR